MAEKVAYYGLWHPERGCWWWSYMTVWTTTVLSVALAQCSMVQRGAIGFGIPDEKWQVRSLLNWESELTTEQWQALQWAWQGQDEQH